MRLGLLSNEKLNPWVSWSALGPALLANIATKLDTKLICPPPFRGGNIKDWHKVFTEVRKIDSVFWIQGSSRPEPPVHFASLMKLGINRSAFIIDAWQPAINKIGILSYIQKLDPCFVAYHEAAVELRLHFKQGIFEWLPFGADTDAFVPSNKERTVFAFWMGRRFEPLHEAMLAYCAARGLKYVYRVPDKYLSRRELGQLAGNSKYFIVTPPDLDNPKRTGGFSPLVMRYMEGLSAGARLLGVLPKSGEYQALLPVDAILQVSPDGSDLEERLEQDKENVMFESAVKQACEFVRQNHSWERRAQQVYDRLTLGIPTGFDPLLVKALPQS